MKLRDGDIMYHLPGREWVLKGHLDAEAATECIRAYMAYMGDATITPGPPRHEWWRAIPDAEVGSTYIDAVPNSRGAFRVTLCDDTEELPGPLHDEAVIDELKALLHRYRVAIDEALRLRSAGIIGEAWATLERMRKEDTNG